MALDSDENVILIGMPGAGKSTVGVLLAKALSRDFIDTDLVIQARAGRRLQEILDSEGLEAFRAIEESAVLSLAPRGCVVATGGSVVYSEAAMRHLKRRGVAVYLALPVEALRARLANLATRGVAMAPGLTLESLFEEREPLYRRHADATVDCRGLDHERVVEAVLAVLSAPSP